MANPLPFVLLGAAFLLMRKKGGDASASGASSDDGKAPDESEAAETASEHQPQKEPWKEGDPIPDDWIPVPKIGDGPQKYFKPPVEMKLVLNDPQDEPPEQPSEPEQPPADPEQPPAEPEQPSVQPEVPSGAHCAPVANWDQGWTQLEDEMLAAINALRAQGYNCPGENQSPAPPVTMNPNLRCSARLHSKDMAVKGYFAHTNLEGEESWDRIWAAGFSGNKVSENITAGPSSVQEALQEFLMSNQGHCEAMFDPAMTEVGIGLYQQGGGYQFYWTQNFGGP